MDIQGIKNTPAWELYEIGRDYHRRTGIYTDTDRNHAFYNGDQWRGAKLGDVEPVQKNFIKSIVKYKVAVIHDNLYGIVYSSQNFENREFAVQADKYCDMLNRFGSRVWERDRMDYKGRRITKDAAINDEGILYAYWDESVKMPVNEIIDKNDIYYGNENDDDIQSQPYILIRKRMPVVNAREFALANGMDEKDITLIIGDMDNLEEAGEAAKEEVDNMVTIVYKMFKKDGTVHISIASRYVEISKEQDTGLTLYPVAHFVWEEKKGSARGEGEVRYLIPNQIEVNRTEMRRVITVKQQAYPKQIANKGKISNFNALKQIGGVIEISDKTVDDVSKIVGTLTPAQMSPDVKELQEDLIRVTRDLAGAGDIATGSVNPEDASGRAILAVQQAQRSPVTEQKEGYKDFIECVAKIWLELLIVNSPDGIKMEQEIEDPMTGKQMIQLVTVPQITLQQLKATVKVDVTPKSVYDRFAQEQTIENLLSQGYFNAQKVSELEVYAKLLDDDSVAPKQKILEAIELIKAEQKKIAQIQARTQMVNQRVQQFITEGPDAQARQMAESQRQIQMQRQTQPEEEELEENEEMGDV